MRRITAGVKKLVAVARPHGVTIDVVAGDAHPVAVTVIFLVAARGFSPSDRTGAAVRKKVFINGAAWIFKISPGAGSGAINGKRERADHPVANGKIKSWIARAIRI